MPKPNFMNRTALVREADDDLLFRLRNIVAMLEAAQRSNGVRDNPVIREWFSAHFSPLVIERAKAAIAKAEGRWKED